MLEIIYLILVIFIVLLFIRYHFLKREIKRVKEQLRQLNRGVSQKSIDINLVDKDFEELVAGINQQIQQRKSANAQQKASELHLKKAISHISHDIRTPLTSILGFIQILEQDQITPDIRTECTATIKSSASRLKILLEDFFELSIIEQNDYPIKKNKIKLNQLLSEVIVGFYEAFKASKLEPIIKIPVEETIILGDNSAIKRVIENLLTNAIKYSEGDITIELIKVSNLVHLTISNPANYLNNQEVNQLFDRFYKVDSARSGKGTGLGLTIAKNLMEKMQGNLSAELKEKQLMLTCTWLNYQKDADVK